jgi:hypothetical protein
LFFFFFSSLSFNPSQSITYNLTMPGRRKSTHNYASEQVINLGTSTRPILTTVTHNKTKKGSVLAISPSSSSSPPPRSQAEPVSSSETSVSPLRRSKRKRQAEDDEYEDVDEETEAASHPLPPAIHSPLKPVPVLKSTTSDTKAKKSLRPPFVRKLEECGIFSYFPSYDSVLTFRGLADTLPRKHKVQSFDGRRTGLDCISSTRNR